MRPQRTAVALTGAFAAFLALAGCSASGEGQGPAWTTDSIKAEAETARESGFTEQADLLEDGEVSAEDYEAAFSLLRSCVEGDGYVVAEPIVSPLTNTTYEFYYDSVGRDQEQALRDYTSCENEFWVPLSTVYTDTSEHVMDDVFAEAIMECLQAEGVSAESHSRIRGFVDEDGATVDQVVQCANNNAYDLYPELKSFAVVW